METRQNLFNVEGKIVVLTGGLGQLGWQFASILLEQGAYVAIFDIKASTEGAANWKLDDRAANRCRLFQIDVTDRASLENGLHEVQGIWGVPHALINNAALDSPPNASVEWNGPFETYSEQMWDAVVNVNLKGVFLCSQVIGGAMAKAGRGSIVNICSIYGVVSPDQRIYEYRHTSECGFYKPASYSATKGALVNLTRYLATYWAKQGVRVNTLTLGGVFNHQDPQFLENYCTRVPLGRMAHESEYNGAILFLLSDASSYMTGSNLIIDGGWTAW